LASEPEVRPDLRFEVKLVAQESAFEPLLMQLRLLPEGLRPLFPERTVQTIYFDTFGDRALLENLAGVSEREKLRLRWYGEEVRGVRARMERKVRRNSLGWKEVRELDLPLDVEGAERFEFRRRVVAACGEPWASELEALEPVQWIRYRRAYWTDAAGRVRITLDREIRSARQRESAHLRAPGASSTPRHLVVELKFAPKHEPFGRRIVEQLPLLAGRSSKFVLASAASHGPLPSFLPD